MIELPIAMTIVLKKKSDTIRLLREIEDNTTFSWAGNRAKPTSFVPERSSGGLKEFSSANYIFFYKNGSMSFGTDIYFLAEKRPKEFFETDKLIKYLKSYENS